jgi:hypothetical protein
MGFLVQIAFLAGFAVILIASIVNLFLSKKNATVQHSISISTDNRMKSTN